MPVVINGSTGIDTVQDGIVTDAKLNLSANSQEIKDALNAGGSAPIYACRAWANFNGTGTVAIRASGNVSSITDNGTGNYTVNFTTAMPDASYAISLSTLPTFVPQERPEIAELTASSARVLNDNGNNGLYDTDTFTVSVFR